MASGDELAGLTSPPGSCRPPGRPVEQICAAGYRDHGLAGIAAARITADGRFEIATAGFADERRARPIEPDTPFRIASLTKLFTAIAVMQLVESGTIALDDPVNRYLKGFRVRGLPACDSVSLRHVLTHTAGIGELRKRSDWLRPSELLGPKYGEVTPGPVSSYYAPELRATQAAGAKWSYAEHGFRVLGQLVADVSGEPYDEYVRHHIFFPLGMRSSAVGLDDGLLRRLAVGYRRKQGRLVPVTPRQPIGMGGAGIISTVADLASFASALLQEGAGIIGPRALRDMWRPHFHLAQAVGSQGLAFQIRQGTGDLTVEHGGGVSGFGSQLVLNATHGVAAVVLTNTTALLAPLLIGDDLLHSWLGTPTPRESPRARHPASAWEHLPGTYRPLPGFMTNVRSAGAFGGVARVELRDGTLWIGGRFGSLAKPRELIPIDPRDPLVFHLPWDGAVLRCQFVKERSRDVYSLVVGGLNLELRRKR